MIYEKGFCLLKYYSDDTDAAYDIIAFSEDKNLIEEKCIGLIQNLDNEKMLFHNTIDRRTDYQEKFDEFTENNPSNLEILEWIELNPMPPFMECIYDGKNIPYIEEMSCEFFNWSYTIISVEPESNPLCDPRQP